MSVQSTSKSTHRLYLTSVTFAVQATKRRWCARCYDQTQHQLWTMVMMFCSATFVVFVCFTNEYEGSGYIICHLFLWASFIKVLTCNYFEQPNVLSDSRWASYLLTDESYFAATACTPLQAVICFLHFFALRTKEAQTALADRERWLKTGRRGGRKNVNSFSILPLLLLVRGHAEKR